MKLILIGWWRTRRLAAWQRVQLWLLNAHDFCAARGKKLLAAMGVQP